MYCIVLLSPVAEPAHKCYTLLYMGMMRRSQINATVQSRNNVTYSALTSTSIRSIFLAGIFALEFGYRPCSCFQLMVQLFSFCLSCRCSSSSSDSRSGCAVSYRLSTPFRRMASLMGGGTEGMEGTGPPQTLQRSTFCLRTGHGKNRLQWSSSPPPPNRRAVAPPLAH